MDKIDRKVAVLMALKNANAPLTSTEILSLMGEDVAIRSLRRWLNELIADGLILRHGVKKNARYESSADASHFVVPSTLFTPESQRALVQVSQPIYTREPVSYHQQWLSDYQPNVDYYLSAVKRGTLREQGQRFDFGSMAGTYARHIYHRLLIDLSYNSSRLEGNTYSLLDTEKLILEGEGADGKLSEEKIMILNHKEAIRYLVDNASKITVCPQAIYTLHYLLSDGLLPPSQCAKLRNHAVKIGGSTYHPLEQVNTIDAQLNLICEKAEEIQDPFEQSFFLLVHIAYLQGFEDCNKRTARLSANIGLIQKNLVPLSFNDIPKNDYINAMIAIYELNDIQPLSDLYCFSYARTCKFYDATVQVMGIDKLRVIYREQRRFCLRHIIAHGLHGSAMREYIDVQVHRLIPAEDHHAFQGIMMEDLDALDVNRIAGLGVSLADFKRWKQ